MRNILKWLLAIVAVVLITGALCPILKAVILEIVCWNVEN